MARLIRSRYEPIEVIGRGGQGEILRAIDRQHDRQVALKVRKVGSSEEREALLSEARILLNLTPHRSLPLVRDDFFVRDRYYLVMDWVEGETLQRILELRGDPGLPVSLVLGYLADAAAALDHLHAHQPPIVHGDVKPANLIVTSDGRVVLVDFGISRPAGAQEKAMGTAGFTAPEVAAGVGHGPPIDVYGLGATTFALLTGAPPSGVQPAWEGLARASAAAAERAIRQALSSDPARRPSSASQLVERLRSWQDTALPTGIVTFLLSDIEGSTSLWEKQPEVMKGALARHNDLIAEIVERNGGRLMQDRGEGDSTFSVFERASDAVRCALDIQLRIAAEPWPASVSLRVRIGVHSGEAEVRGGAYTGNTTNLAARIRSLAQGGQILLSQTTAGLVRGLFPSDCTLVDLGEHRLKGLVQAEQVFEVRHPDLPGEAPPVPPAGDVGRETRLPRPATSFVGRRAELVEIDRLLSGARLLTLTGPGGTGKTRLALELARDVEDRYPDGVFFVDLSSLADAGGVPRTIAAALGVLDPLVEADLHEGQPGSAIEDRLQRFLAPLRTLLLIDNCEHLQDECARICGVLLAACSSLSILTTSREALRIDGERVYHVPGLSGPSEGAEAASLERSDAVRLFIERAVGVRPGYRLAADDAAPVAEICKRLDGLPLAIELVVARLPVLTVSEILPRLDDALRGVAGAGRATPERHRSLEAAIRWSHELLDEQERALFRRLAAFVGGATLEAIERVCVQPPMDPGGVLDTLQSLVEKSLVVVEQDVGVSRYRFLETVRRFALDRLAESGESEDVRRRHRDYFQSLVPAALPGSSLDESVLPTVAVERDNIRAGLRWSLDAGEAELALWMAIGQYWYWRLAGLSTEIQGWIDEAFARGADDSPLRAAALLVIGGSASGRLEYTRALALWEECLPLFRSNENHSGAGWTLLASGRVHGLWGDRDRSDRLLREAIESLDAAGDAMGAQWARFNWAWIALSRGEDAVAASLCEQIMAHGRDLVAPEPVGAAQIIDGVLDALRGDIDQARALWRDGLAASAESAPERQWFLLFIGGTELRVGAPMRARQLLRDSLQLAKRTGLLEPVPWSLELAAVFAVREGASTEAARLFGTAQRLERESGFVLQCAVWAAPLLEARGAVETTLGADRAERERSAGERMAVSAAVDLALEVLERLAEPRDEFEKEDEHGAARIQVQTHAIQPVLFQAGGTPFIGRQPELERLRELFNEVAAGQGKLVLIGGEPGIGKTRLAEEAAFHAIRRGALVLVGHSYDAEGDAPYTPFIEALTAMYRAVGPDSFRAVLGPEASEIARIMSELRRMYLDLPPPLDMPSDQERRYLFTCVAEVFARIMRDRPLLLILEDIHWSDQSSFLLLRHLLGCLSEQRLVIAATYRDSELEQNPPAADALADLVRRRETTSLSLKRLPEEEVGELLQALAGKPPPDAVVRVVFQETDGNPFFVEETYRHLTEERRLLDEDANFRADLDIDELDVPDSVRLVISRRATRLSENARRALRAAAVLGRTFEFGVLDALGEVSSNALLEAVEEAERCRFIAAPSGSDDRYTFVHELVRQTLLSELTAARRQRIHLRTADTLESMDAEVQAPDIARHLMKAGPLAERSRKVHFLTLAAKRALGAAAFLEALAHTDVALLLVAEVDEAAKAELLYTRGQALDGLGRWEEAQSDWETALSMYEAAGNVARVGAICADIALRLGWGGRFMEALAVALRGLDALGENGGVDRCALLSVAGRILGLAGDYRGGTEMVARAEEIARRLGDDRLLGRVLGDMAAVHWSAMEERQAAEVANRASALLRATGDLWALAEALWMEQMGWFYVGSLDKVDAIDVELEPLAGRLSHVGAIMAGQRVRGCVDLMRTGDLDRFLTMAMNDLELCTTAGLSWVSTSHSWIGWTKFWRGEWDAAGEDFALAADLEPPSALEGCDTAGLLLIRAYRGERDLALSMIDRIRKRDELPRAGEPNTLGRWTMMLAIVEALVLLGERKDAAAFYPLVLESMREGVLYRSWDFRLIESIAGMAASADGRWDAAQRHFETALHQALELPLRMEEPDVRRWYGLMLAERGGPGDLAEARGLLEGSQGGYERLGMDKHADRVRAALGQL